MSAKEILRQEILKKRRALLDSERQQLSLKINEQALNCEWVSQSRCMGLYWPLQGEVEVQALVAGLRQRSCELYFPRLIKGQGLEFVQVASEAQLQAGELGVREPCGDLAASPLSDLDGLILPGLAFDEQGHRLGWGKGYYDRTLANFRGWKLALAFDFQVLAAIPSEPHDISVDGLITEQKILLFNK